MEDALPVGTHQQGGSEDPPDEQVLWLAGDAAPQTAQPQSTKGSRDSSMSGCEEGL